MKDIKRLKRKIDVLNKTADRLLKSQDDYDWYKSAQCNCGHIVMGCGMSRCDLSEKLDTDWERGSWDLTVEHLCGVSGVPFRDLFSILYRNGFTKKDIPRIEECRYNKVIDRLYIDCPLVDLYSNPVFVAFYFYAWADMLSEELEIKKLLTKQISYEKS